MNAWVVRASWRQLAVLLGALVCPFLVLLFRLRGDHTWPAAVLLGVGVAVVCAPLLGRLTAGAVQTSVAAGGPLEEHDRGVVERAARRGPVPEDPRLRAAALRVAEDRLAGLRRTRVRALTVACALVLVAGLLAVGRSPWWWLAVVAGVGLVLLVLVGPARLQRRTDLLRGPGPGR